MFDRYVCTDHLRRVPADSTCISLKKECKSDTCKFQGSPKTIKFDEVMEVAEFTTMFGGKGTLIQPTPTNKPSSTVTIIDFVSFPSFLYRRQHG